MPFIVESLELGSTKNFDLYSLVFSKIFCIFLYIFLLASTHRLLKRLKVTIYRQADIATYGGAVSPKHVLYF